jgi:nucleoside-diphosphate-sugar epimerase
MMLPRVDEADLADLLAAVPQRDWQQFAGQHVFVAGGTGFLGCWLLEALLHANARLGLGLRLSVLSRRPAAFRAKVPHLAGDPAVRLIEGDIRDTSALDLRCDYLVHAAADVENADADPVRAFDAIVQGTRGAIALAARAGARRVLHVSSGAVYGAQPPALARIPEPHPSAPDAGDPRAAYGLGKRVSEWLAEQAARPGGFDVVHARVFALIGPYLPLHAHFAAGNFLADAAAARPVRVAGNGSPLRSYLYAGDAAAWLLQLLVRGAAATAYNVGSEEAISIRELADRIASLAGVPVAIGDPRPASGLPARYVPDTALARKTLGLVQYTSFAAALQRSFDWARRSHAMAGAAGPASHQAPGS